MAKAYCIRKNPEYSVSQEIGVSVRTILSRLRIGWSEERALSTEHSLIGKTKMLTFNGKTQSIKHWAEELGVPKSTLKYRLRNGWSIEKTLSMPFRTSNHH